MKSALNIYIFLILLSLFACKKDSGIVEPAALQDFSGVYWLQGTMNYLSNPPVETPLQWTVTAAEQDGYQIGDGGTFKDTDDRWTLGGIYSFRPDYGQFRLIVYGGKRQDNATTGNIWTIAALDSIFQPGNHLSFGTDFGQAEIEFGAPNLILPDFLSQLADNSNNKVTIEEVNDFKAYLPERTWAKQVVVSFDARLKILSANSTTEIELKNCRASLLFIPNVQ